MMCASSTFRRALGLHRPHEQQGSTKSPAKPLNPKEHAALLKWMSQFELRPESRAVLLPNFLDSQYSPLLITLFYMKILFWKGNIVLRATGLDESGY
jgi:hypothetical protein